MAESKAGSGARRSSGTRKPASSSRSNATKSRSGKSAATRSGASATRSASGTKRRSSGSNGAKRSQSRSTAKRKPSSSSRSASSNGRASTSRTTSQNGVVATVKQAASKSKGPAVALGAAAAGLAGGLVLKSRSRRKTVLGVTVPRSLPDVDPKAIAKSVGHASKRFAKTSKNVSKELDRAGDQAERIGKILG